MFKLLLESSKGERAVHNDLSAVSRVPSRQTEKEEGGSGWQPASYLR